MTPLDTSTHRVYLCHRRNLNHIKPSVPPGYTPLIKHAVYLRRHGHLGALTHVYKHMYNQTTIREFDSDWKVAARTRGLLLCFVCRRKDRGAISVRALSSEMSFDMPHLHCLLWCTWHIPGMVLYRRRKNTTAKGFHFFLSKHTFYMTHLIYI